MKFGISLPNNQGVESVRELAGLAEEAEALGFNSVWTSEHLFHSSYVEERQADSKFHLFSLFRRAGHRCIEGKRNGNTQEQLPKCCRVTQ